MTNFERITKDPVALVNALMEDCDTGCCEICVLNNAGMCTEESNCEAAMLTWLHQESVSQ